METAVRWPVHVALAGGARERLGAACAWAAPFALVLYLALRGGGYDAVLHDELGIAAWWIVLVGALVGALPTARTSRAGWIALGLLAAFAGWQALASTWSASAERSADAVALVGGYVAFLTLAVSAQRQGTLRPIVHGTACAIAAVAGLAVLSRLHPAWFPTNETAAFLPGARSRLSYPINYWNGLAALVAMGLPLVLGIACTARALAARAAAATALPLMVWCIFLTLSRGGALAGAVALLAYVALARERVLALATMLVAGAGAAILIVATTQRPDLAHALGTATARDQGGEMLAMGVVVCAGAGLLAVAVGLVAHHAREPAWVPVVRRRRGPLLAAGLALAVAGALAAGAPGALGHAWRDFKRPEAGLAGTRNATAARYGSTSGNGRYQYWAAAQEAVAAHPVGGTGPGTFELWWARHAGQFSYVQNAHSLYFETLGEDGVVGLALIAAFLATILATGVARTVRAGPRERTILAGATAAAAGFCVSAGVDWVWQIPVLPIALLVLAGAVLARPDADAPRRGRRAAARGALVVAAVAGGLAIAPPLARVVAVRASQAQASADRLGAALADARTAAHIAPGAAGPRLQEALVLEEAGALGDAAAAAGRAVAASRSDWHPWFVLARIRAEQGRPAAALAAYRRARALDPRSPIFRP
jgi:hypothetical protein